MKKPAKKKTKKRRKKQAAPRPYKMPHTAAELGIDCSICHAPATLFDFGRGQRDHRAGFVCNDEPAVGQREKLLIRKEETATDCTELRPTMGQNQ